MDTVTVRTIAFAVGMVVTFAVVRIRRMPFAETLAWRRPKGKDILQYTAIYLAWIGLTELILWKTGMLETGQWQGYTAGYILVRAAVICLLAPFAEEIIFRGMIFYRFRQKLGPVRAIILTAIIFTALHIHWGGAPVEQLLLLITFADALYYAWVRQRTGSIFIPMLLHALGNAVAVAERIL